jgi:phosphate/sulfate permease
MYMKNFVRILAFLLLIGSTIIFILKIKINIPISHTHLLALFIIGAISLLWANKKDLLNK